MTFEPTMALWLDDRLGRPIFTMSKRELLDNLLGWEIFHALQEAKIVIENWCRELNEIRSHGSLGYRPPAPQTRTLALTFALAGGGRLDLL